MLLDTQAKIDGEGNLTLGLGGYDDGLGDSSHGYGKANCRIAIPLNSLVGTPTTNLTEALVRTTVGQYARSYTAGDAITPNIPVFLPMIYRTMNATTNPPGVAPTHHGWKITKLRMNYTIGTLAATSIAVVFTTETAEANATALANRSTTPLGTVAYQNPPLTVVGTLPVATQATPYVCDIVPATPAFVNIDGDLLTAEIQLSLQNTTVFTIRQLWAYFTYAMY